MLSRRSSYSRSWRPREQHPISPPLVAGLLPVPPQAVNGRLYTRIGCNRTIAPSARPRIPSGASLVSSPVSVATANLGSFTRVCVLAIAAIGFLFDTYELLMFPVIGSSAVGELIHVNPDG